MNDARDKILAAAKTLFAERGYGSTSVRDIVGAAGVNVSLVSYYFGGKEGLYEECIRSYGKGNQEFFKEALWPATSAADMEASLVALAEGFLERTFEEVDSQRLTMREYENNTELFKRMLSDIFKANFGLFVTYFAEAQQRGFVVEGIEPAGLAVLFHGHLNHLVQVDPIRQDWYGETLRDVAVRERVSRQLVRILLHGAAAENCQKV